LLRVYTGRRMQWARHAERIKRACAHLISGPFGT
jgi:branched-subunit amino acid aminotransferase/4-amino-4-deoxychorismate lyase